MAIAAARRTWLRGRSGLRRRRGPNCPRGYRAAFLADGVLVTLERIAVVSMCGPTAGRTRRPERRATGLQGQSANVTGGEGASDADAV
nr:hypothetical protein OG781_35005 [Streptomyces sp. NBC_00830]